MTAKNKRFVKTATRKSYYGLSTDRKVGNITAEMRIIAAAMVLGGQTATQVGNHFGVTPNSVRNWVKTLANRYPGLVH